MASERECYLAIHKPTETVFGIFHHKIHADLFLGSFHHIKIDDFMEVKKVDGRAAREAASALWPSRGTDGIEEKAK